MSKKLTEFEMKCFYKVLSATVQTFWGRIAAVKEEASAHYGFKMPDEISSCCLRYLAIQTVWLVWQFSAVFLYDWLDSVTPQWVKPIDGGTCHPA